MSKVVQYKLQQKLGLFDKLAKDNAKTLQEQTQVATRRKTVSGQ